MNIDIKFFLFIFLRRFHYFIIVATLIVIAGLVTAFALPPVYRAQATLLLEAPQISSELASSTVSTGQSDQIKIIRERLLSRANMLDLARNQNVYEGIGTLSPDFIVRDMRSRLNINLESNDNAPALLSISFSGEVPDKTASVANEVVTLVLDENAEMRNSQVSSTLDFFEQEFERLGKDLDVKSSEILAFKLANSNALPEGLDFRRSRLITQQNRLNSIQKSIQALLEKRERMVSFFERTGGLANENLEMSPLERELQSARIERQSALLTYSERHPSIQKLDTRIATLESQVEATRGATGGFGDAPQSEYEFQLSEIDREVFNLEEETITLEAEIKELTSAIDETPGNAIALSELERSYASLQGQYNDATARLAQARTGERIEVSSKGQRISVIEYASKPISPSSPPRLLIAAGSVIGGIGAGLAVVILLELLTKPIRRSEALVNSLGIKPIGTLPYIQTGNEKRLRSYVLGAAALLILAAIPITLFLANDAIGSINGLISRIGEKAGLVSR